LEEEEDIDMETTTSKTAKTMKIVIRIQYKPRGR
jgi:hypothetical protein